MLYLDSMIKNEMEIMNAIEYRTSRQSGVNQMAVDVIVNGENKVLLISTIDDSELSINERQPKAIRKMIDGNSSIEDLRSTYGYAFQFQSK